MLTEKMPQSFFEKQTETHTSLNVTYRKNIGAITIISSPKTSDTIVSYGERLSSLIASRLIQGAVWFDSRTFIKTEKKHNKHTLDTELTNRLVREAFKRFHRYHSYRDLFLLIRFRET